MELKVNDYKLPASIGFNYEELKQEITAKAEEYASVVYTDDKIKDAKNDRAGLNKLKKALNEERIRMEREYMSPFNEFKRQINEIITIIDKPCKIIDDQIKAFEGKAKESKTEEIQELFKTIVFQPFIKLENVWSDKWLNASVSLNVIKDEMEDAKYRIGTDILTISQMPQYQFEAMEVYKQTLDIRKALEEANKLSEMAKKKADAERIKAEAEHKKTEAEQAEIEKQKEEEIIPIMAYEVKDEPRQWIAFEAELSATDAGALKAFFEGRNISFRAIRR